MRTVALALVSILLTLTLAHAAPPSAEEKAKARRLFESATRKYDTGRFDEASVEFQQAYDLTGDPALLFNIAQSHRLAGHAEKALFFYRSYLRREGSGSARRGEIEQWINELTEQIRRNQETSRTLPPSEPPADGGKGETKPPPPATTTPPTTPTPPPSPPHPVVEHPSGVGLKRASYALFAVGVVALGAGGALSGVTVAQNQKVEDGRGGEFTPALRDAESLGKGAQAGSIAMYAIGGASVVTAAALLAVGVKRERVREKARVTAAIGPGSLTLAVGGAF